MYVKRTRIEATEPLAEVVVARALVAEAIALLDAAGHRARAVGATYLELGDACGVAPNTVWTWWGASRGAVTRRPATLSVDSLRRRQPTVPAPRTALDDCRSPALVRLREKIAAERAERVNGR